MHKRLLAWYEANKRPLPWRGNPTPYAVWVSEIMAQQTRMAQLLPFYTRFMARFPTAEDLAEADLDGVLSAWAGMGYYARARNLHLAARIIKKKYGGGWPTTRKEWEALPGVGSYTAGAVLSIAFGQREAAVDGNVLRIYARLANDATDIASPVVKTRAALFIHNHMPETPTEISAYTQALMELGALVCVPKNPRCGACPLANECRARIKGRERELPAKTRRKPTPVVPVLVLLIISPDGRVLMRRRTEGLLRGMWVYYLAEDADKINFGRIDQNLNTASAMASLSQITALLKPMGYTCAHAGHKLNARHTFTHRVWDMACYEVRVNENHAFGDYRFLTPEEREAAARPAAMKYFEA
jgi:A/G-specific adenine glycosylase